MSGILHCSLKSQILRDFADFIQTNSNANIDMGCLLVRRIIDRLENPTIEKIGTLYNALAKEKISNYGRNLLYYYENKSWRPKVSKNGE